MDIALFSPSSIFVDSDDNSSGSDDVTENYVERNHSFPGMEIMIREFSFHQLNANLLWPGTFALAEWLIQHKSWIEGKRVIELGRHVTFACFVDQLNFVKFDSNHYGTGALAIFLRKSLQLDITTSDYDDQEIEENIAYNCKINGLISALPHIKHTWGETFPNSQPKWDVIIASDILLYVKQYPNLIRTLRFLLKSSTSKLSMADSPPSTGENTGVHCPIFLMSWRRRIGKEDETLFFQGCNDAGLEVQHLGSRVYCIKPKTDECS
ncbi:Histone-arginine methyltransferase METTL23-like protein [Drosera capensis]